MQRIELTLYHTPVPRAQRGVRDKLKQTFRGNWTRLDREWSSFFAQSKIQRDKKEEFHEDQKEWRLQTERGVPERAEVEVATWYESIYVFFFQERLTTKCNKRK